MTDEENFYLCGNVIHKTVATGQPRYFAILSRKLYILRRLLFGVVYHLLGVNGPNFFENKAGKAVKVTSTRHTETSSTFSGTGFAETSC
jgi:hypothetical protein